jgi:hypothetical protein
MNVWGKRSFDDAFGAEIDVDTIVAAVSVQTPLVKGVGGVLSLDGDGNPVNVLTGLSVTGNEVVSGSVDTSELITDRIQPHPTHQLVIDGEGLPVQVQSTGTLMYDFEVLGNAHIAALGAGDISNTGFIQTPHITNPAGSLLVDPATTLSLTPGGAMLLTTPVDFQIATSAAANVNISSANGTTVVGQNDVSVTSTNGVLVLGAPSAYVNVTTNAILVNNYYPVPVQTFTNIAQLTYAPFGSTQLTTFPDAGIHFGWAGVGGNPQRPQWGWEYEFGGFLQVLPSPPATNQIQIFVLGGPTMTTPLSAQFTNAINNVTLFPQDFGYVCKVSFNILTISPIPGTGTARINFLFNASPNGGAGLPVTFATLTSNCTYDNTGQNLFDVQVLLTEPTATFSVLWGRGVQWG